MSDRAGLSRGDRNRNLRLGRMSQLLPPQNAIVGIDLADSKQAAVATDHDSRVIARRRVTARAWELGELLDWAIGRAVAAGFASVTVACEPTGHRWRVLDQLAAQRGLALVCVQPLLVYRARESEDLTFDKSDPKDAPALSIAARVNSLRVAWMVERARRLGAAGYPVSARDLLLAALPAAERASGDRDRAARHATSVTFPPRRVSFWYGSIAVRLRTAGGARRISRTGGPAVRTAAAGEPARGGRDRGDQHC